MFGILVTFIINDKWCDLHKLNTDIRQKEMETSCRIYEDLINILDLSIPICINLLPFLSLSYPISLLCQVHSSYYL